MHHQNKISSSADADGYAKNETNKVKSTSALSSASSAASFSSSSSSSSSLPSGRNTGTSAPKVNVFTLEEAAKLTFEEVDRRIENETKTWLESYQEAMEMTSVNAVITWMYSRHLKQRPLPQLPEYGDASKVVDEMQSRFKNLGIGDLYLGGSNPCKNKAKWVTLLNNIWKIESCGQLASFWPKFKNLTQAYALTRAFCESNEQMGAVVAASSVADDAEDPVLTAPALPVTSRSLRQRAPVPSTGHEVDDMEQRQSGPSSSKISSSSKGKKKSSSATSIEAVQHLIPTPPDTFKTYKYQSPPQYDFTTHGKSVPKWKADVKAFYGSHRYAVLNRFLSNANVGILEKAATSLLSGDSESDVEVISGNAQQTALKGLLTHATVVNAGIDTMIYELVSLLSGEKVENLKDGTIWKYIRFVANTGLFQIPHTDGLCDLVFTILIFLRATQTPFFFKPSSPFFYDGRATIPLPLIHSLIENLNVGGSGMYAQTWDCKMAFWELGRHLMMNSVDGVLSTVEKLQEHANSYDVGAGTIVIFSGTTIHWGSPGKNPSVDRGLLFGIVMPTSVEDYLGDEASKFDLQPSAMVAGDILFDGRGCDMFGWKELAPLQGYSHYGMNLKDMPENTKQWWISNYAHKNK
jgi:hypothetical protein